MTALAGLLATQGCRVTGSDRALYPPTSTILERLGLDVRSGFDPAHLDPAPDLIAVGNAVSRGNPEVEAMLDRGLSYTSMPRLIAERFLEGRHPIVVAGTHGKTTTTAMVAWLLSQAGRDPGFLIGGLPQNFELPFALGQGSAFVIEGDEYDTAFFDKGPKFMHYRPRTALLGTVEFDHADIYRDADEVVRVFERLTNLVPGQGLIVRHEECEMTRQVTRRALSRVEGYGTREGAWRAVDLTEQDGSCSFRILRHGETFAECRLPMVGEHNVRNALAATAAVVEQGLSADEVAAGLASFSGVRRRLELRGEADGVAVLDDFAHHPTAIEETLRGVRARYPGRRVWAVLEPRSWSLRRNVFQERLARAFGAADEVIIAAVYGAADIPQSERLDTERLVRDLDVAGVTACNLPDVAQIVDRLTRDASTGDVVVVMSNGGFDGIHERLLTAFEGRATAARRETL
ncbi:MAG: UDP-N-acetylmuramate:L-alanyl-gamma-D-glutamyl-meso-diaminopimelate ligase [Actinobacteria bacterium]|nr:UDP-N-acetylmuramate:L-alanyl-gamma-D-glutamyl-meso-diaminopimelate ligase [Actinomycetota bacterium]